MGCLLVWEEKLTEFFIIHHYWLMSLYKRLQQFKAAFPHTNARVSYDSNCHWICWIWQVKKQIFFLAYLPTLCSLVFFATHNASLILECLNADPNLVLPLVWSFNTSLASGFLRNRTVWITVIQLNLALVELRKIRIQFSLRSGKVSKIWNSYFSFFIQCNEVL